MSGSRNNHYVPQWYQTGFLEPGQNTLAYLDLKPPRRVLDDGRVVIERSRFKSPTSRCFVQRDLYSTFFGAAVNDEIERKLFGAIDMTGAPAIKAFTGTDVSQWHRHFEALFTYIDIQKLRTPKGLDWLRAQYPALTQNELMREMQGLQMINCTIWTEGVREIVSAEDSGVKFIISDHPVTIFNPGMSPEAAACAYPFDPSIALKGSQTIFPLSRDFCLILTNLEYARDAAANPLEKRTFARNYRGSMARTDAFIRTRKLSEAEVGHINMAVKARARRYVAAGQEAWLHPEAQTAPSRAEIAATLRPPEHDLWHFGGEMFARFEDGHVVYQDEFGRHEPEHQKMLRVEAANPKRNDPCGCGSARSNRVCCEAVPAHLRPSWTEVSIRERNLGLYRAAIEIFSLDQEKTWTDVRREMTDEKIRRIFEVFAAIWPLETDVLQLLPKPDGRPRAVYSGLLHPEAITDVAAAAGLYFGELIVQHPFMHPRMMRKEYSPLENPQAYRGEILKSLLCFLMLVPLVEVGLVNLMPDPCAFDAHLRTTMIRMAKERSAGLDLTPDKSDRAYQLWEEAGRRTMMQMPRRALKAQIRRSSPQLGDDQVSEALQAFDRMKLKDPLAVLQADPLPVGEAGGQFMSMTLAPNFEMAMYLAQATGSCIVTDSKPRFKELLAALLRRGVGPNAGLPTLARQMGQLPLAFPQDIPNIVSFTQDGVFAPYPRVIGDMTRYLRGLERRGPKPNFEAQLSARLTQAGAVQDRVARSGARLAQIHAHALLPDNGLQDHSVNRLLLMSSSEHHWPSVPAAFYLEHKA